MKKLFLVVISILLILNYSITNAEVIRYTIKPTENSVVRFANKTYSYAFCGNLIKAVGIGIKEKQGEIVSINCQEKYYLIKIKSGEFLYCIVLLGLPLKEQAQVEFSYKAFQAGELEIKTLILAGNVLFSGKDIIKISPACASMAPSVKHLRYQKLATSWAAIKKSQRN